MGYVQARGERRRAVILGYLRAAQRDNRPVPTVREIAIYARCSVATAHRHLQVLAQQGMIHSLPREARTIRIL